MKQKIIKIGNSVGIILPKQIQEELGIKLGDNVAIEYNAQEKTATLGTGKSSRTAPLTPEFYDWLNKFNAKYKTALTELAKK